MPLQQTATTPTKYSRLSQMISQMGPGIVYILTVLGAGDLVSNSALRVLMPKLQARIVVLHRQV